MATPVDVAVWAQRAGWRGQDLVVAVAVALATSGGNPDKTGGLYGLGRDGDGQKQSDTAYGRWRASGWGVFAAHRNKGYLIMLPPAVAAVAAMPAQVIVTDPGSVADLAKQLPGGSTIEAARSALALAYKAGAWVANPDNWMRVLTVAVGAGMVLGGVAIVAGRPAMNVVKGVKL